MILVTGGTGLVGTHLIYELLLKGKKVRAIRRVSSKIEKLEKVISYYHKNPKKLLQNLEWVNADILDIYSLEEAMEGISQVYHCAAIISFNPSDHKKMIENNTRGTANIVNAALTKKVQKLCHVSSIAAVGRDNNKSITSETDQWSYSKGQSAYAISKHESEREVWRGIAEGLDSVIVNPSIIFGPGHWEEGSSKIFTTIWNGLKFYTKGRTGYVDVRDVACTMIVLMESKIKNERYIINSENMTYKDVFETISQEFKIASPKFYISKFMSEIVWRIIRLASIINGKTPFITKEIARTANKTYTFSNKKITSNFNYKFITIQQSIADTAIHFLQDHKK
jgi:nucleoside-diphosphate-sugar epimerase